MTTTSEIDAFLAQAGWQSAERQEIAGDASSRRFLRLVRGDARAILMIDGASAGGSAARFVEVGQWLASHGYSTPAVLSANLGRGLTLVEDLGNRVAAREVAGHPERECEIYGTAADLLADLSEKTPPPGLQRLDSLGLGRLSELAWEWYAPVPGRVPADAQRMGAHVTRAASHLDSDGLVVSLRDFHAENILWRPRRVGLRRVGLVDFQDAVLAHPAYDLVSLVQDARRDVGSAAANLALDRFCRATGRDRGAVVSAMAIIGAARALRILGIFARLALRDGKARYVAMIPRVWGQLVRNLDDPTLAELRHEVSETLPAPDETLLSRLVSQAGRHPSAAMLFAAGRGTRMRPLTDRIPKPLIRVGGRALIDHAMEATRGAGVERVVINLHHFGPMIRDYLGDTDGRVLFSDESDRLLETGGGMARALPLLGPGPVFSLNSDAVWLGPNPLSVLRAAWDPGRMGALLLLVPGADMVGHVGPGDFVRDEEGRLSRAPGLIYTGAQIIEAETVQGGAADVFSLNSVWDELQRGGRLYGTVYPGRIADVGRPEAIATAEAAIAKGGRGVGDVV